MAKQFRKAKRRPSKDKQREQDHDRSEADLQELWDVLAETKALPEARWHLPWKNGLHIAELCLTMQRLDAATRHGEDAHVATKIAALNLVRLIVKTPQHYKNTETYWKLQDHQSELITCCQFPGDHFILLAVRTCQLVISNSHGGGQAYNAILRNVWERFADDAAERWLRAARCADTLGMPAEFDQNVEADRLRRAFYTAWDRGLYQVAYAVGG